MRPRQIYLEEHLAQMDALPVTERCLFCTWTYDGSAVEGRTEYLQHRLSAHPEVKPPRRRPGRHLKSFRQARLKADDVQDILSERQRRARLHGITIE
jgi:hypothetical protein